MGQRHQTFIFVENRNNTKPNDKISFGTDKNTVLVYHNQWLYGRSALFECAKVLRFCSEKDQDIYRTLYADSTKELSEHLLSLLQINQQFHGGVTGVGFHSYYLKNTEFPSMRDFIDSGDNNDGVTIIDAINKKYCFMAFCGLECDESTREQIVNYKPMSAEDYVLSYYPNKKANWVKPPADLSESIDAALNMFRDYQVLTLPELREIFPKQTEFNEPR